MAYEYVNSKGQRYYLHCKAITRNNGRKSKLYYFSRKETPETALDTIPEGYEIIEMKTGLPALRRKKVEDADTD